MIQIGFRNRKVERAPALRFAFDPDVTVVRFDNPFDNGQPESRTHIRTRRRTIDLVEPIKDAFEFFRGYPDTVVGDLRQEFAGLFRDSDSDLAAVCAEFERIPD